MGVTMERLVAERAVAERRDMGRCEVLLRKFLWPAVCYPLALFLCC